MSRRATLFALFLLSLHPFQGAYAACDTPKDEVHLPERFMYQVAGSGRLYLYKAPNEACLDKSLFVIPGDSLTAYTESGSQGEWTSVMYIAKDGEDYSGWVKTNRLKFRGAAGMDMTPEDIKFYQKAAAAADAGKLGSPLRQ
jgi:hypothetical protein